MVELPTEWSALMLLVFSLGARHGLDADHLATIDGLTRYNSTANPRLSRWCGVLFSVGHGLVVTVVAILVAKATHRCDIPRWIEHLGAWISIGFLLALGCINLIAVINVPSGEAFQTVGLKTRWLGGLQRSRHPVVIMSIGALFALSFDTLSQAAMFSVAAAHWDGITPTFLLGLLFAAGMILTDGINGYWVAQMVSRTDRLARSASRIMGATVAILSLVVSGMGIAKYVSPTVRIWSESEALMLGTVVLAGTLFGFVLALRSNTVARTT